MKNKTLKLLITIALVLCTTFCAYSFSFRNMTLDFIDISDTHITTTRNDTPYKALSSSSELLKDAIEQINKIEGLDFVLFTGDMVDSATADNYHEYYNLLTKLRYPTLNAFGNHDFSSSNSTKEDVLNIVRKYNPNYTFNDSYYAFTPKTDYRIIILDSVPEGKASETSNGYLTDEQLAFLDNELLENQDKIAIIALHHPPLEPFASQDHKLLNADKFNDVILKYNQPIVVISGHYHATKIRRVGNIVYISTPSLVTYPMAFRHIKIINFKDRVEYKFEYIETKLSDIQENNRQSVISYSLLKGNDEDRDTTFVFHKKHSKSIRYKKNKIKKYAKDTKTSEKEIAKLSKPQKEKKKKIKTTNKNKQNTKTKKTKKDNVEKPKIIKEKNKNKSSFINKIKNKFHKDNNKTNSISG